MCENACDLSRLLLEQHRKEHLKQAYDSGFHLLGQSTGMTAVLRRERNQSIDERHARALHCRARSVIAVRLALEEAYSFSKVAAGLMIRILQGHLCVRAKKPVLDTVFGS